MFPIRLFPCCFVELGFWVSVGASSIRRMIITKLSVPFLLPFITFSLLLEDTAGKLYISSLITLLSIRADKSLLTLGANFSVQL